VPFLLRDAASLLANTPATLRALLSDLPEPWLTSNEGGDTWNAREVVAHMADLEDTDWMPRVHSILQHGTSAVFAPIDRLRFRTSIGDRPVGEIIDIFAQRRTRNLDALEALHITEAQLSLEGVHPSFGNVTLEQLLATWAVHDLTHLSQIVRVMANRYASEVGPWRQYLSVLRER
jgi:hypothetical protein